LATEISELERVQKEVRRIQNKPTLAGIALGLPHLDRDAWRHGRSRLAAHGVSQSPAERSFQGPDVYLCTQVYNQGGHTALIGDFVRARRLHSPRPHLIVTAAGSQQPVPIDAAIQARTGIPDTRTTVLNEGSLDERLELLLGRLLEIRPRTLFLFHHADDPLAIAVAQPAICGQCVLVHHADATATLGLHIPGISIIELNPWAAAISRAQRFASELLLLTCPDPGPRPHGFRLSDGLITATSGSAQKFRGDSHYAYADLVAEVLRTTTGRHLHIGPLDATQLAEIAAALRSAGIEETRFVHRDWVPSVAAALWEFRCDVYIASFPTDGARVMIEVAASGTPYVAHASRRFEESAPYALSLPGTTRWSTWVDLRAALVALSDKATLEEKSCLIRDAYLLRHQPSIFQATLEGILAGGSGVIDPDASARDQSMLAFIVQGLTDELIKTPPASAVDLAVLRQRVEFQASQIMVENSQAISDVESRLSQLMEERLTALEVSESKLAREQKRLAVGLRRLKAEARARRRSILRRLGILSH